MGISNEFFVGVYLLAKVKPETFVERKGSRFCPKNKKHIVRHDAKYCPTCGTQTSRKTSKKIPYLYELLEGHEREEDLVEPFTMDDFSDTHMLMIGNLVSNNLPTDIDFDDYKPTEITPELIDLYIKNFKEVYAEVIEVLRERTESIEIKFGALSYWS